MEDVSVPTSRRPEKRRHKTSGWGHGDLRERGSCGRHQWCNLCSTKVNFLCDQSEPSEGLLVGELAFEGKRIGWRAKYSIHKAFQRWIFRKLQSGIAHSNFDHSEFSYQQVQICIEQSSLALPSNVLSATLPATWRDLRNEQRGHWPWNIGGTSTLSAGPQQGHEPSLTGLTVLAGPQGRISDIRIQSHTIGVTAPRCRDSAVSQQRCQMRDTEASPAIRPAVRQW